MNSLTPKISVIIPVYNTADYLLESVGSITRQTLKEIEIIAIDDGSTDQSLPMLKSLAEKDGRITVISQTNSGQSVARNRGLEAAHGEYVYFMDSDDLLDEEALYHCYNKCCAEHLDMVIFGGESFFEDKNLKPVFDYDFVKELEDKVYDGAELFETLVRRNTFSTSPCLYVIRRDVIENHHLRFYPGIIHEDNLLTALAYLCSEKIGCIPLLFFKRRVRGNSTMTSTIKWKNIDGYLTVCAQMMKYSEGELSDKKDIIRLYVSWTMTAVCYKARFLKLGERLKFISIMLKSYSSMVPAKEIAKVIFSKR